MNNNSVKFLVKSSIFAAIYAVTTLLLSPLSFGVIQIRLSEVMVIFSLYSPAAIPGLTIGCFISGILGPNGIIDAVLGSIATLIGTSAIYLFRSKPYIGLFINVLSNSIIIGCMLSKLYSTNVPMLVAMLWVGAGEFVSSFVLALIAKKYLDKYRKDIFKHNN